MPVDSEQCLVCGTSNLHITKKSTDVTVGGIVLTCEEIEQAGLDREIPPNLCAQAQQRAQAACGCASVQDHTNSSPTTPHPLTYFPTITPLPTITPAPSYKEKCNVCFDEKLRVSNEKKAVVVGGIKLTCAAVEEYGATGYLPPSLCPQAQTRVMESCGCSSVGTSAILPPVARPAPAPIVISTNTGTASSDSAGDDPSTVKGGGGGLDFSSAFSRARNRILTAMAVHVAVVWLVQT